MTLASLGCTLLALLAAAPQQPTLRDARVRIAVEGDTARVTVRYRVTDAADSLRLNAVRLESQRVVFDPPLQDPRLRLDTLPGLLRVTATRTGRAVILELWYAVTGGLERIPLFVPEAPTAPGASRVVILVDGLRPERTAAFPFPRFRRSGAGPLVATPDHLPSFVAVVAPPGGAPVPAMAQWAVLAIALGGTGAWLLVQLRTRRGT